MDNLTIKSRSTIPPHTAHRHKVTGFIRPIPPHTATYHAGNVAGVTITNLFHVQQGGR